MTMLISEHSRLYHIEMDTRTPPQQQHSSVQKGRVEWLSQEDINPLASSGKGGKTPQEEQEPCVASVVLRLPAPNPDATSEITGEGPGEGKSKCKTEEKVDGQSERGESEVAVSPSKQSKALPSWRSSLKGSAASGGSRVKIGGSAGDVSAASSGNWLMNGLSSLRAHRRTTSSGERVKDGTLSLKDSTLSLKETLSLKDPQRDATEDPSRAAPSHRTLHQSHRLSAYDNVAPSSLSLPADASIWTAFEISLAEPEGGDGAVKSGRNKEKPAEEEDKPTDLDPDGSGPEDDLTGTNERLNGLVTELKQELKRQRTSYETSIRRYVGWGWGGILTIKISLVCHFFNHAPLFFKVGGVLL